MNVENSVIINRAEFLKMIPVLVHFVREETQFVSLKEIKFVKCSKLIDKTDLDRIKLKADAGGYGSFKDLLADFTTFIKNCRQLYTDKAIVNAVDALMEFVNDEIHSIITCNQCYQNAYLNPNTSFVMPCDKPHLIVWVKPKGYNFWPAKLMHIVSLDEQMVHVRFFGDHSVFDIPAGNCLLYSQTHPDVPKKCHLEIYTKALNEATQYINNIREIFGAFSFTSPELKPFEPEKLQEYLSEMIAKREGSEEIDDHIDLASPSYEKIANPDEISNGKISISGRTAGTLNDKPEPQENQKVKLVSLQSIQSSIHQSKRSAAVMNADDEADEKADEIADKSSEGSSDENSGESSNENSDESSDGNVKETEKSVRKYLNKIFKRVTRCNSKNTGEIGHLKKNLRDAMEQNATFRAKIQKLEAQNHELLKKKICKECNGNIIVIDQYCSNECIENSIKKRLEIVNDVHSDQ